VQEVEAAKDAGMQSLIVVREGNAQLSDGDKRHAFIQSFDEINIQGV
jgi:enolase-phosphatase E1